LHFEFFFGCGSKSWITAEVMRCPRKKEGGNKKPPPEGRGFLVFESIPLTVA
jgi:hypothetical protein